MPHLSSEFRPDFHPDASAHTAHASLRRSLEIADRAQHCAVLWFAEIHRRGLFRELGFASMQAYAIESLGFSRAKCGDYLRLAAKLDELPRLRESVARGEVGYTKAREVIKVATPRTEARWVAEAAGSSRQALAAKVARVRKKAASRQQRQPELLPAARIDDELAREVPQRVTLEMSAEQFARWEALWEKLRKLGVRGDRVEEMLEALGTFADVTSCKEKSNDRPAPRGARPSAVIHVHECPTCRTATVQTSRGEQPIAAATVERLRDDATLIEPGGRARQTIPPKTRREVLQRDRHRCQTPGCPHTRFLEIHHRRPVSQGGGNDPANLVTLCSACHGLLHRRGQGERIATE